MQDTLTPAAGPAGADTPEQERIRRRVHQKAELYRHLVVYLVVGAVLAAADVLSSPRTLWFYWPMGFWAIGLVLHVIDIYVTGEDAGMERRMLEREMERHRHARG